MTDSELRPPEPPKPPSVVNLRTPDVEANSPLDFALRYAALGWKIVPVWWIEAGSCACGAPCKSPGKHPIGTVVPFGQNSSSSDPAALRAWWARYPRANVAVYLQPSGLAAIDIDPRNGGLDTIDSVEAQHGPLVSEVMQFSGGGGEHRIFAAPAGTNIPGKLGPGVDVKLNGYIVLEPSNHVSGGFYAFEASSSPLDGIVPSPLPDWLRDLSTQRSDAPEAPAQARDERLIADLEAALPSIPTDDRELWLHVGFALHNDVGGQLGYDLWTAWSKTSAKFDPVDQMRTWRHFRRRGIAGVTSATVFHYAQQHGWANVSLPPAVPAPAIATAPSEPVSAQTFQLPGILGQVQGWIEATARKPQPMFAVQAALAFGATILGRRYVTTQRNWPSVYLLNIGKSGSGKEHAKWALERLLEACQLQRLIGPAGYTSDAGLLSSLHRQPSHLAIVDEFGKILEAASVKHNPRAASTMRGLMESWGRCDGTLRPQGYSTFGLSQQDIEKLTERSVVNPALTLLGMATPDSFYESIGSAAARDGFLNRFLIVESDVGRQPGRELDPIPVPQTIVDWAASVHTASGLVNADLNASLAPAPKTIAFSKAAAAAFRDYERECLWIMDQHDQAGLGEAAGRTTEIAMRLGLTVAVGSGETTIGQDSATWAIDYTRHHLLRTLDRLANSVADSEFEALKLQVLGCIRKAGPRGLTERDLSKASRRFRAVDQRAQTNVLNSLSFTADIQRVEYPPASGRGRPRKAWIIPVTNDDEDVPA